MVDFFVSYTGVDRAWAEWIAACLEDAGYSTRLQAWDFDAGSNFILEMDSGVTEAERTILVLTPASIEARFVRPEWAEALRRDPEGKERRLIPVRVRDCEPVGLLAARTYIDLVDLGEEDARRELLTRVEASVKGIDRERLVAGALFPGAAARKEHRFPGDVPPVWNLPSRAVCFSGRKSLLKRLERGRHERSPVAILGVEALHGLGGVGKTRLCVEYAYGCRDRFDVVWLVNAASEERIVAGLAALSDELDLNEAKGRDRREAARAALRWLERHQRWLLVFDDAPSPAAIANYLPVAGDGQVLVTSRWSAGWRNLAEAFELDVLDTDDAARFLLARTGSDEVETARQLVAVLGHLPLALEQAAAYIESTGIGLQAYLDRFREHSTAMLAEGEPLDYPATVATTWLIAFEQIRKVQGAADVLFAAAFLAEEPVRRSIFASEKAQLEALAEPALLSLDRAVTALREVSLVSGIDAFEIHRLVKVVARSRLSERDANASIQTAQALIWGAMPEDVENPIRWSLCDNLVAHATVVARHAHEQGVADGGTAAMLYGAARYLKWRFDLPAARQAFESVIALGDGRMPAFELGSAHMELADVLAHLELGAAVEHGEKGVALLRSDKTTSPAQVAFAVMNLGTVKRRLGDRPGAAQTLSEALDLAKAVFGEDDPQLGGFLINLANALPHREALPLLERAVFLIERGERPDPHELAVALSNLANALGGLGRPRESLAPATRAIELYEAAFGKDFERIAPILATKAVALREINRLGESEEAFRRVIQIEERIWGDESINLAPALTDYARTLQLAGRHPEARRTVSRAISLFAPEALDDRLAEALLRRGDVYRELGLFDSAKRDLTVGLRIRERLHGDGHPATASLLTVLGATLRGAGESRDAVLTLGRAVGALEARGDLKDNLLAGALNNLGNALGDAGDFAAAPAPLERALEMVACVYGREHPEYAGVLANLAIAYSAAGRDVEADRAFGRVMAIDPTLINFVEDD